MARKRRLVEAEDLDSSGGSSNGDSDPEDYHAADLDPDARAERERHRDPYGSRKRRKGGVTAQQRKEQAALGIWADEVEEDHHHRPPVGRGAGPRANLLKTPHFVKSSEKPQDPVDIDNLSTTIVDTTAEPAAAEDADMDDGSDEEEDMDDDESDDAEDEATPAAAPRIRSPSPDETVRPSFGGTRMPAFGARSGAGLGAGAGLGGRGGLGMMPSPAASSGPATPTADPVPERKQTSFLGAPKPAPPPQAIKLSHKDKSHFAKLEKQGGLGFRMLAAQGWKAGAGLGEQGKGIVAPVESRLRPKGMGLGHEGFGERTQSSIEEAKRRGHHISDDEDEKAAKQKSRRGRGGSPSARAEAWKQPKPKKTKTEFKTYEEILAESGQTQAIDGGLGQIVDLTGQELPSLASTLTISGQPVFDDSRLPELRHNLRLITDTTKGELDALAREAKAGAEKRRWIAAERARTETRVGTEAARIMRLKTIMADVEELVLTSKAAVKSTGALPSHRLAMFDSVIDRLLESPDFDEYGLDGAVVAAIAPCLQMVWAPWAPLDEPDHLIPQLSKWRVAFGLAKTTASDQLSEYGGRSKNRASERSMTPYESLLWNHWLPKIRSAINYWSPEDAAPAVKLLAAWSPLLPTFIRDNVLDQLILPKLLKAIADWSPRRVNYPLNYLVFPWLPHLGDRFESVTDEAKRRFKSALKGFRPSDGVPTDFALWQKLFGKSEWDTLLLQWVLPALGAHLRDHFRVNPKAQEMEALVIVLDWRGILRKSMFSQLLEAEFVPKWLNALYTWLTHAPDYQQVRTWLSWWESWLGERGVDKLPGIQVGLGKAINLTNQAEGMGEDAKFYLEPPNTTPSSTAVRTATSKTTTSRPTVQQAQAAPDTITFRALVEAVCAERDVLFQPLGRSHPVNGLPLFRVSAVNSKGVVVYLADEVAYAQVVGEEKFEPVGLEEMINRAGR